MPGSPTASDDNPFRVPPDNEIFLVRDEERRMRAKQREAVKTQKVWEKTTTSSRLMGKIKRQALFENSTTKAAKSDEGAGAAAHRRVSDSGMGSNFKREKDNVTDFVAKKREMFLVQMSLDVKKAEIMKLDERAKQKEEALKKSQQLLEEDVVRFDAFLQHNDQKAHTAMKQAEQTTKRKQDKIQQIKQIRSRLAALQSEITKHREMKDECLKYKTFLVKLTPQEWQAEKATEKSDRKHRRKKAWMDEQLGKVEVKMREEMAAEEKAFEEKALEQAGKMRRRGGREVEEAEKEREKELDARRRRIRRKYPTAETFEQEYQEVSSGEEMPLFFTEPKQLLDVFVSLEESNLFLIQNSQDTEQTLEELQQRFDETKRVSNAKTEKMQQGMKALELQIADERSKIDDLNLKLSQKHGSSEQDQFLRELMEKTIEVNAACGHDTEHDPDTLLMLAAIEAKLEEHLGAIDDAEANGYAALVDRLEREAEVARREKVKRERKEQHDKKTEERLKASLLRSQAPIHKKTGKQIMFRSAPLVRTRRVVVEDDGYEEAVRDHEVLGVWISKDGTPNAEEPEKFAT